MGAHSAPVHTARHSRGDVTAARSAPRPSTPRFGRLAGTGVLTASAALAMTGAGGGVALASDAHGSAGILGDNDVSLLCGILGGDDCSSDTETDDSDSDVGSSDDSRSLLDRMAGGSAADSDSDDRSETSDAVDRSSDAGADRSGDGRSDASTAASQRDAAPQAEPAGGGAPTRSMQLDTPPAPGQVRTIQVPG